MSEPNKISELSRLAILQASFDKLTRLQSELEVTKARGDKKLARSLEADMNGQWATVNLYLKRDPSNPTGPDRIGMKESQADHPSDKFKIALAERILSRVQEMGSPARQPGGYLDLRFWIEGFGDREGEGDKKIDNQGKT